MSKDLKKIFVVFPLTLALAHIKLLLGRLYVDKLYFGKKKQHLSHRMGKPTICIGENKGADQLRSNCEADQRLCFRYNDSTIPLLSKSKIPSL